MLLIDWALGALRFSWPFVEPVFAVVNLPWSVPFLWLKMQPAIWWRDHIGIDDEIGMGLVFLLMVGLQASLLTAVLSRWTARRALWSRPL